jgi:hypothetical protein
LKPDILYSALYNTQHNPIQQSASYDNYKYLYKIVKKSNSTTVIPIDQHTNTEARHEIKIHILSFMETRHDVLHYLQRLIMKRFNTTLLIRNRWS